MSEQANYPEWRYYRRRTVGDAVHVEVSIDGEHWTEPDLNPFAWVTYGGRPPVTKRPPTFAFPHAKPGSTVERLVSQGAPLTDLGGPPYNQPRHLLPLSARPLEAGSVVNVMVGDEPKTFRVTGIRQQGLTWNYDLEAVNEPKGRR